MWGMEGFGFGGGQWDDDAVHREGFARKSGAASRREETARAAFTKAAAEVTIPMGKPFVRVNLLPPSIHLTTASWSDFSAWVKTHPACKASRREATAREKMDHKETRKGKCYWVDVLISAEAQAKAREDRAGRGDGETGRRGDGETASAADAEAEPPVAYTYLPDKPKRKAAAAGRPAKRLKSADEQRSDDWMTKQANELVDKVMAGGEKSKFMLDGMRTPIPKDPLSKAIAKEIRRREKAQKVAGMGAG